MRTAAILTIVGALGVALTLSVPAHTGEKKETKKEKDAKEGRKGSVIGILVKKEKNAIEVRADGEEAPRKYVPQWVGGQPKDGGGPDKAMLKSFQSLKIGSRVEVQWLYEERLRVMSVKVLAEPKEKKVKK